MHDGAQAHFFICMRQQLNEVWRKVDGLRWTHSKVIILIRHQPNGLLSVGIFGVFSLCHFSR
jgi:hypothetical protein